MAELGEFGVSTSDHRAGVGTVEGRCYRGTLRVGGRFSSVTTDGSIHAVTLVIELIEAYRRQLDEIEEGLTARLHLRGSGWEHLQPGAVLKTEPVGA